MAANLATFFETSKKVRGGRFVWVKDGNGESRHNVLLGCTLANPFKGYGYAHAADLFEYRVGEEGYLLKSFEVKENAAESATTIVIKGDGFSTAPEVGNYIVSPAESAFTPVKMGKITAVVYDEVGQKFTCTLDKAIGAVVVGTVLVEGAPLNEETATHSVDKKVTTNPSTAAIGYKVLNTTDKKVYTATAANTFDSGEDVTTSVYVYNKEDGKTYSLVSSAIAEVFVGCPMCKNPNTFIESDMEFIPSQGYGLENVNFSLSAIYGKEAYIPRMQPLPKYALAKNRSYITKIFSL